MGNQGVTKGPSIHSAVVEQFHQNAINLVVTPEGKTMGIFFFFLITNPSSDGIFVLGKAFKDKELMSGSVIVRTDGLFVSSKCLKSLGGFWESLQNSGEHC